MFWILKQKKLGRFNSVNRIELGYLQRWGTEGARYCLQARMLLSEVKGGGKEGGGKEGGGKEGGGKEGSKRNRISKLYNQQSETS